MANQNVIVAVEAEDQFSATFNKFQTELRESHGKVQELERVLKRYKAANDSVINSTKQGTASFRTARSGVAQLGYQVQDIAVQIQGGQNLGIILGQQGSQIASVFGPSGVVAGAIISIGALIGSALINKVDTAQGRLDELKTTADSLSRVFDNGIDSVDGYKDSLAELAAESKELALAQLVVTQTEARRQMEVATKEVLAGISGLGDQGMILTNLIDATSIEQAKTLLQNVTSEADIAATSIMGGVAAASVKLGESFNISSMDALKLINSMIEFRENSSDLTAIQNYRDTLASMASTSDQMTLEFARFFQEQYDSIKIVEDSVKAQEDLKKAYQDVSDGVALSTREVESNNRAAASAHQTVIDTQIENEMRLDEQRREMAERYKERQAQAANEAIALETMLFNLFADIEEKKRQDAEATAAWKRDQLRQQLQDAVEFNQKIIALEQNAAGTFGDLAGSVANNLKEGTAAQRVFLAAQKGLAVAQALMNMQVAVSEANKLPRPANIIGIAQAMATGLSAVAGIKAVSFEGGGYTGTGIRAGGLDGRGGMPAIVHPNETVIDHTKGHGMGGVTVNFTIQANDTAGFDRLLQSRRGQIISMINQAVNNRGRTSVI
ncbi:MAG: hypothetical protein ACO23R_02680 [bacterium]